MCNLFDGMLSISKYKNISTNNASSKKTSKQYSYADGVSVLESSYAKTTLTYRGSDQGGGVGGINYAEYSNGSELNYKIYNLRGDVIKTVDANKQTKSFSNYYAFGEYKDVIGDIKTDDYRANTKVEDDHNLLNEGKRFRQLKYGIFLTPDPLEYADGYNPYIYCGQNPWGKWDPLGLAELQMNFKYEGVGINDPISGPAPAGYTAKNAEISTNIEITGTGFTPGKIYTLAVEINVVTKNSDGTKELSSQTERQTNYFEATAEKNGDINFGKSANIGQDDANLVNFVSFQEGVTTEISIDIDAAVVKNTDFDRDSIKGGLVSPLMNFVGVEDGKATYNGDGPSRSIFGPQNAHTGLEGEKDGNKIRGIVNNVPYISDTSIASIRGSIKINHVGGSNEASVTTSGIGGKFSNGEGRTNVNIKHNERNEE